MNSALHDAEKALALAPEGLVAKVTYIPPRVDSSKDCQLAFPNGVGSSFVPLTRTLPTFWARWIFILKSYSFLF